MSIEICPLCGLAAHVGKCEKEPKGKWWCGICLAQHVPQDDAPPVPKAVLYMAGVKLASRWCMRCGCPVCPDHMFVTGKHRSHPRCHPKDCRERPPGELSRIKTALERYVPDYLIAGPARCRACSRPAYRTNLCSMHYQQVRAGKTYITVERSRPFRGQPSTIVWMYVPVSVREAAKKIAEKTGKTFSKWAADLVRAEVKRRTGADLKENSTLFE